jgi:hypothetical protein
MPKDKRVRANSGPAKPKKLRKRLRKAEADLAKAQRERDEAVARVQALSIIADEVRAQLAEAESSKEVSGDSRGKSPSGSRPKATATDEPTAARKAATTRKPAAAGKAAVARKPATTRKPAAAKQSPAAEG